MDAKRRSTLGDNVANEVIGSLEAGRDDQDLAIRCQRLEPLTRDLESCRGLR